MEFAILIKRAKGGDNRAMEEILEMYMPLLRKHAVVQNTYDEDLYQELCCVVLDCVKRFRV